MARESRSSRHSRVHQEAMRAFDRVSTASWDDRQQAIEDRRFYSIAGAQWDGPLSLQFENRPKLEINKVHAAIIRIISEYRNNRISAKFRARDPVKNPEGDKRAQTVTDLYRADEQDSVADEAYDNAFEEAVGGGMGAWLVSTKYVDDESEDDGRQRICIEPIFDADSTVYFDDNAKRYDKSDATWCMRLISMTRTAFEEAFPDEDASSINPQVTSQWQFDWFMPDWVYVADFWKVEEVKETINFYRIAGDPEEQRYTDEELKANDGAKQRELVALGARLLRQKVRTVRKVRKYLLSGSRVLEDSGYIVGKNIPVVPVYGKRWWIEKERFAGHVRYIKDPQRLYNMQVSALAETAGFSSVQKPYFDPEQVEGFELEHARMNIDNPPYLRLRMLRDADGNPVPSPLQYTKSPEVPPALAAILATTATDMREILGNQEQGDKVVSNIAEETFAMAQMHVDNQTGIYLSNFAKSMQRCGVIYRDMLGDVYVEEDRELKTVSEDGKAATITLNQPNLTDDGVPYTENSFDDLDLDVVVSVGPSSDSKRQATIRNLMKLMALTQDPEILSVLMSMAIVSMKGEEGVGEVSDFFRQRMLKIGAVKPSEEEAAQMAEEQAAMANKPPSPQDQLLIDAASKEKALGEKARTDSILSLANAEKAEAEKRKIEAQIHEVNADTLKTVVEADNLSKPQPQQAPGERAT